MAAGLLCLVSKSYNIHPHRCPLCNSSRTLWLQVHGVLSQNLTGIRHHKCPSCNSCRTRSLQVCCFLPPNFINLNLCTDILHVIHAELDGCGFAVSCLKILPIYACTDVSYVIQVELDGCTFYNVLTCVVVSLSVIPKYCKSLIFSVPYI